MLVGHELINTSFFIGLFVFVATRAQSVVIHVAEDIKAVNIPQLGKSENAARGQGCLVAIIYPRQHALTRYLIGPAFVAKSLHQTKKNSKHDESS